MSQTSLQVNAFEVKTFAVNASGRTLGRVASEVAYLLLGKSSANFSKSEVADISVEVVDADKMHIGEKKRRDTKHVRYSGYPGGIKYLSSQQIIDKKGNAELLRMAVSRMIPRNRIHKLRMQNLKIKA